MKSRAHIILLMLGMLIFMPSISFSQESDTLHILNKIWEYRRNFAHDVEGETPNVYMRYTINTERRNPTLFLVPTLYSIAKGDRKFISESYGKFLFDDEYNYDIKRQIISGTIPHNRQVSSTLIKYLTPNIYGMTLYKDHQLSPFHRTNRKYYRYKIYDVDRQYAHLSFRPKLDNTQLVKGHAVVDVNSGRIVSVTYDGEYDMIKFHVDLMQGTDDTYSTLPQRCKTDLQFKFLGNRMKSSFLSTYHCPTTLPDSLDHVNDRSRMETLRTIELNHEEQEIYHKYDERRQQAEQEAARDTIVNTKRNFGDVLWDIGDHLVTSTYADAGGASLHLSPILNPQYISYSHSRGLSYRIQLGIKYRWNKNRYLTFEPRLGYNFKIKQFFFHAPLRMNYNPKRHGYAEIVWANGNRISNSSVLEAITKAHADSIDFSGQELDYFTDNYVKAVNNVVAFDWLEIMTGIVYHIRRPVNVKGMQEEDMPTVYRSFAPLLTLHISPWRKGPYFTFNYERAIKGIFSSNLGYERIEMDVSHKFKLSRMRLVNLRGGCGFYTDKKTSYFLDYTNFHDENLPEGWDDDWTGQFQLLDSRWYNTSNYYLRAHASYESPLLLLSFLPFVGRYVETERIYLSTLSIQNTRAYSEIGYGISTRFLSIGAFASFLNTQFQDFGFKFTFELFRKW
ncbi:MAG: hypothetical protein IKZ62_07725 [Prevotella sp.]|nr:hypothetical protein [Prevotella sp.]